MKSPTPEKRLRTAMQFALGAARQVKQVTDDPELEAIRAALSEQYARLRQKLEEREAAR